MSVPVHSIPVSRPASRSTISSQYSTQQPSSIPTRPKTNAAAINIYQRHLNRSQTRETSRASFAYLFAEMITYAQRNITSITQLEDRLNEQGYPIGLKLLDLLLYRTPNSMLSTSTSTRPTRILPLLQFVSTTLWKHLFGRPADALERSQENKDEYMITDNDPVVNAYISVPKEMSQLNCAAYVAGIIEGVCDGCGFYAKVSAHSVAEEEGQGGGKDGQMWPGKTVFLVKFKEEVLEREEIVVQFKT